MPTTLTVRRPTSAKITSLDQSKPIARDDYVVLFAFGIFTLMAIVMGIAYFGFEPAMELAMGFAG